MTTLFHNATLINEGIVSHGWLLVDGEMIASVGRSGEPEPAAEERFDCRGRWLLPGVIDTHVHFRDPGLTHKADMAGESLAAVMGGVTSVIDMPNTIPATTTIPAWEEKMDSAAQHMLTNYAFFIGATDDNLDELLRADYSRVAGVKLFMGSSTGNMLVKGADALDAIFARVNAPIAVHAEDEDIIRRAAQAAVERYGSREAVPLLEHPLIRSRQACIRCSRRAIDLARRHGARLHLCHLTTAEEARMLESVDKRLITGEVCVSHLWFTDADYATRATRIKCNPAVKSAADREALRRALAEGVIDTVATDHAPHLLVEKQGGALTAASGMPMVQFSLPVMLELARQGVLTPAQVVERMCHAPARVFGIERRGFLRPGYYADLAIVDPEADHVVTDSDVVSRCGWTPLQRLDGTGTRLSAQVTATYVNGRRAWPSGERYAQALSFQRL